MEEEVAEANEAKELRIERAIEQFDERVCHQRELDRTKAKLLAEQASLHKKGMRNEEIDRRFHEIETQMTELNHKHAALMHDNQRAMKEEDWVADG